MNWAVRFGAMLGVVAPAVDVIDLQRGVLNVVLVVQHRLDVGAYGVTVDAGGDQDVR
jgi:hypothetical protein